ncbi:unnamed protein product [Brassica napus]|uniref:(rape) hypothetical protein n=1 Tax=Brassica napus TaxID=3708 RepID=A0A817A0J8_BRANA|nr:unnamed protein product [Brassica napus]
MAFGVRMLRDGSLYVQWICSLTKSCKRSSFHPQKTMFRLF